VQHLQYAADTLRGVQLSCLQADNCVHGADVVRAAAHTHGAELGETPIHERLLDEHQLIQRMSAGNDTGGEGRITSSTCMHFNSLRCVCEAKVRGQGRATGTTQCNATDKKEEMKGVQ